MATKRVFRVETTASTAHILQRVDEASNKNATKVVAPHTDYAKIRDDELLRCFIDFRRAYLALQKLMQREYGLELKSE